MTSLTLAQEGSIPLDKDGYLRNLDDWSPEVAGKLAAEIGISLNDAHWEVIHTLRAFYEAHGLSPATRPFVKLIARELGPEKGRSIYLMKLFPGNPALITSKIAGLPRPSNCF
ncbi:MAG: TusE/DsrC/DsvC family sulfur relay protein [Gammaproteobacteria bacterium]